MLDVVKRYFIANRVNTNFLFVGFLVCGFLQFHASAQNENPALLESGKTIKLNPLPLNHVRLTGGPLKSAQDADAKYLLELEPDRMLAFLRQRAGLKPKATGYGGWDGPGRNLTGHIAGHYLSGVSLMWAATGDVAVQGARGLHCRTTERNPECSGGWIHRRPSRRRRGGRQATLHRSQQWDHPIRRF